MHVGVLGVFIKVWVPASEIDLFLSTAWLPYPMTLDCELLELDGLGVFPRPGESIEDYVSRGWKVVRHTDCEDALSYVEPILRHCEWKRIEPAGKGMVEAAAETLGRRFLCSMGWLDVYLAETDFAPERSTLGFSLANKKSIEGEIERQIPPFVVLNRDSLIPKMPILLHEMVHSARELSDVNPHKGPDYVGDYEEMVADGAGNLWNRLVHARLLFSQAFPEYLSAKRAIEDSFGEMAGYVQIRMPYDEILEFTRCPGTGEWRKFIPLKAECGEGKSSSLRYRIMKERLGL